MGPARNFCQCTTFTFCTEQPVVTCERIRLQDLARALVDEARLAEIRSWFEAAGMVVDTGRMRQAADAPMGWTLVARRG